MQFISLHVGNFVSPAQAPHKMFLVGERLASPARARKRSDVTRGHMWASSLYTLYTVWQSVRRGVIVL